MRAVMNDKIASGAITDARVWDLDLTTGPIPSEQFDLIVTVLTLHHIPTLEPVLANFAALLVDGGYLCIADLEEEDGSFHGEGFDGHHGFNHSTLESLLDRAGFTNITFTRCHHIVRDSGTYPLFLATCVRRERTMRATRTAASSRMRLPEREDVQQWSPEERSRVARLLDELVDRPMLHRQPKREARSTGRIRCGSGGS